MNKTPISGPLKAAVAAAIERGDFNQTTLAKASGVSRSKICNWLNGRATITIETADRIAATINHTI